MPKISSGKRYAQAAFELALEKKELDSWQEGLGKLADLTRDAELVALLENPKVAFAAKKGLLQKRLEGINPLVINLSLLLTSRGKFKVACDILAQYSILLDKHHGVEHAEVITAVPLSDGEKKVISQRLGAIIDREVIIDAQVAPSIIGGFKARIGDTLIDGSVRYRLESLRKSLIEASG